MKTKLQRTNVIYHDPDLGVQNIPLSYQLFGQDLHSAPIVLINHALTGNSTVAGERGWWKTLVGDGKIIDTNKYTIVCFNIPGNGYDDFYVEKIDHCSTKDVANFFIQGLDYLGIEKLYALVGGSIGGAIGWEMLSQRPDLAEYFIPIATDYKTSDWLHSQCLVQQFLLESSVKPMERARIHAMLCYRTPESLNFRFKNEIDAEKKILKSHDWLNYHGKSLTERFSFQAYKLMNKLLMSIDVNEADLEEINAEIHLIAIDTDLFFPAFEMQHTHDILSKRDRNVFYHEIKSIHGHDAFLMEYEQLNSILKPLF